MNGEERQQKVESYGKAIELLETSLKEFPREMWTFRAADGWSIQEIVMHIADSEANSYIRCRRLIAEPGKDVIAYEESIWAKELHYHDQNPDDAVQLFKWLRGNTYKLVKTVPEATWSHTTYHPEAGMITMDDWLNIYEAHIREHVAQMRGVYEEWQKAKKD